MPTKEHAREKRLNMRTFTVKAKWGSMGYHAAATVLSTSDSMGYREGVDIYPQNPAWMLSHAVLRLARTNEGAPTNASLKHIISESLHELSLRNHYETPRERKRGRALSKMWVAMRDL